MYSNNPLTRRLFIEAGYEVRTAPMFNRDEFSGSEVRRRIVEGGEWEKLVPRGVVETIHEVKGDERLQEIMKDNAPEATI